MKEQQTIDDRLGDIVAELIDNGITLQQACDAFEQKCVTVALKRSRGRFSNNITRAAKLLGVHRNTLHNKMRLLRSDEQIERGRAQMARRRR